MRTLNYLPIILFSGTAAMAGVSPTLQWELSGFEMPESVLHDEARQRLVVSSIVGNPGELDGSGYLSLLSPDGSVQERQWIKGFDAPKGMALLGDELLVTDIDKLHVIDVVNGIRTETIDVPDARFLNDISAGDGAAYFSDMLANRIWQYRDGEVSLWSEDSRLSHPNGVLVDGGRLLVGNWGAGLSDDFTTESPGDLLSVDIDTGDIEVLVEGVGNIDGIARAGGQLWVSDWVSGSLYAIDEVDGSAAELMTFPGGLADIASGDDILYLPSMLEGKVLAFTP